VLDGGDV